MPILSLLREPSDKARYKKALDAIVSKKVRERDGYRCRKCGRKDRVYHHHIFTKSRPSTCWDEDNGVTLCYICHRWAHSVGEEFRQWVLTWMSKEKYDALYLKSQMRVSYKAIDLEWLLREMRGGSTPAAS